VERSKPLRRKTELAAGDKPLKRTGIKRSRSGVMKRAAIRKPRGDSLELKNAKRVARRRSRGRCEVRTPVCTGTARQGHHIQRRSQGGPDDAENLLDSCNECHTYLHAHPAESYERGWLKHSWE
jgi:hypothetical protein